VGVGADDESVHVGSSHLTPPNRKDFFCLMPRLHGVGQ
jgi:hypothetical protein